ncbi:MAG TPA: fumarylacetoacetate hydrolase family protein, partial [Anaerolineales bacterium]|nr:fumarylacetoacetate hydrolase family protein [Anaerolineales bacterium]
MKLLTFHRNNILQLGICTEAGVIDVTQASKGQEGIPVTMDAVIQGGAEAMRALQELAAQPVANWLLNEQDLQPGPCVGTPEKLICIGLNYKRHAQETGMPIPEVPVLFSKFNNTLAETGEPIPLPDNALQYDYEVELGVVIGKETRYVSVDEALDYVFGYFTVNDMSVRDLQFRTSQWLLGKTPDKFFPTAPYLVTADEVGDPQNLGLSCWVNGELRQNSNTSDMIFSVAEIISYISQYMTLKPGDVISTGTPEGVVMGMKEKNWLKSGDEVVVEVEGLGKC